MPNFTSPDLVTELDTTNFRSQLNENFRLIENALVSIQNALPSVSGASVGQSNLTWVERAITPNGMIGTDSFYPSFSTDMESLVVNHLQNGDFSSCVINGLYHQTQETYEKEFSEIIPSDGTYPVVLAVKSNGYPSLSIKVLVEDTDNDYDLLLYRLDVTRSGSAWLVQNLRRVATVILDHGSQSNVFDAEWPLTFHLAGSVTTGLGERAAGVIAPWDCEVLGGYARLATAPTQTDGLEIEIRRSEATDAEPVVDTLVFSAGDSGDVISLVPNEPATQVSAGEFLRVWVTVTEVVPVAADLYVTLLVRRIWHPIYR